MLYLYNNLLNNHIYKHFDENNDFFHRIKYRKKDRNYFFYFISNYFLKKLFDKNSHHYY